MGKEKWLLCPVCGNKTRLRLDIAALAVMDVLAVQQVLRICANLVIIAAVCIGERPQGVALVRMLMAAVVALGGAM